MPPLKRILYVDDDSDIQELVVFALELAGDLMVVTCGSGRDALTRVVEFGPDLIMLDVMMPDMDGPATLAALRRLPDLGATPVVFMTAKAQTAELSRFLQMGVVDIISKPFNPMELGARVLAIWAKLHE